MILLRHRPLPRTRAQVLLETGLLWLYVMLLGLLVLTVAITQAASVTLAWNAVTTNTDGTPVTLGSYRLYRGVNGATPQGYGSVGAGTTTFVDSTPAVGTNLYYVTAVSSLGSESAPSNTVTFPLSTAQPQSPAQLRGAIGP